MLYDFWDPVSPYRIETAPRMWKIWGDSRVVLADRGGDLE